MCAQGTFNSDAQTRSSLSGAFVPLTMSFDRLFAVVINVSHNFYVYLYFSYNLTNTTKING